MIGEDITPQTGAITSSQPDAVTNIQSAGVFGVTPDVYKTNQEYLKPTVDQMSLAPIASPVVAQNIQKDPETAAAIAPDANSMSWQERQWSRMGQFVKSMSTAFESEAELGKAQAEDIATQIPKQLKAIPAAVSTTLGPEAQLNELGWKKLIANGDPEKFTSDDAMQLGSLKAASADGFGQSDFGLTGPWEKAPAELIAAGAGMGQALWKNKGLIAAIAGVDAGAGAIAGSPGGPVGIGAGAATGLISGIGLGGMSAMFLQGYKDTAGSTLNALDEAKGADGQPLNIDPTTKSYLAHGIGLIAGGLQFGTDYAVVKSVPFLNKLLSPADLPKFITDPANTALKDAIIEIGKHASQTNEVSGLMGLAKSAASAGVGSGLQQVANITGMHVAQTYQDGQLSFTNGLMNAADDIFANKNDAGTNILKSTVMGAAVGAGLHIGLSPLGPKAPAAGPEQEGLVFHQPMKDVNPSKPGGSAPNEPGSFSVANETIPSDIVSTNGSPQDKAIQALVFQDVVDANSTVMQNTGLHKLAPPIASNLRAQMLSAAGLNQVWMTKEDLQKMADTPEKGEAVRGLLDDKGQEQLALNAPVAIPTQKFLDLHDQLPDASEYMRLHPEGPSALGAKEYVKQLQDAEQKRALILTQLNAGEKSPAERAYAAELNPTMTDTEISKGLGTKETAQAYLDRLDVEEFTQNEKHKALLEQPNVSPQDIGSSRTTRDQQLANISTMRQRVTTLKDSLPADVSAKQSLRDALQTQQPKNDVFGEADYLNQPTLDHRAEGIFTKAEIERINRAQLEARKGVAENINEAAKYEQNQVIDIVADHANEIQRQIETERIANDPNLAVVDQFHDHLINPQPSELTATHAKEGYSPYAMDPRLLSYEQNKIYAKDAQLKAHKAFIKGGISPDDAASLLGLRDGDALLNLLSKTPRRSEVIEANMKSKSVLLREEAADSVDLNKTALANAFHDKTANSLAEMKTLIERKWPTTKTGIKKIALTPPRLRDVIRQAKNSVSQTKVGDLNPNQFKVGGRISQRLAVEAVLNGDYLKAVVNKRAEALNSEMAIATHQAIGEVNKIIRFARKFNEAGTIQELKDAGSLKAANELLDLFNLNPAKKGTAVLGSYQKWVAKMVDKGVGNFAINPDLSDVRKSINDMTVDQVLVVGDRLKSILYEAKKRNFLNKTEAKKLEVESLDQLANMYGNLVMNTPGYDIKKATDVPKTVRTWQESLGMSFRDATSIFTGSKHIVLQADNDQLGGIIHQSVEAPLYGTGGNTEGFAGKTRDLMAWEKQFDAAIDLFNKSRPLDMSKGVDEVVRAGKQAVKKYLGRDNFNNMENNKIFVPEWANNPKLNNGKVNEGYLFNLLLNMGNEGNILVAEKGHGIDRNALMSILERHLDHGHLALAQNMIDMMEAYGPRVIQMKKDMEGVEPKMVEGTPITLNGKTVKGGYWHIRYAADNSYEKLRQQNLQAIASFDEKQQNKNPNAYVADDMTVHGHDMNRTGGNGKQLDLSMAGIGRSFEGIVHDLNFRKPIANALKILTHETMSKHLAAKVGLPKYNALINSVKMLSNAPGLEQSALYDSGQFWDRLTSKTKAGVAAAALVYRANPVLIAPLALINGAEILGPSGVKHMTMVLMSTHGNPVKLMDLYKLAAEINPAVLQIREGFDANLKGVTQKQLQGKSMSAVTGGLDKFRQTSNDVGYSVLSAAHTLPKVVVTVGAYLQFMAGEAQGHLEADIAHLSPEERHNQAMIYASQAAGLTTTSRDAFSQSTVERDHPLLTQFWPDARNTLNNFERQARGAKESLQSRKYLDFGTKAAKALLLMALTRYLLDRLHNQKTPFDKGLNTSPLEAAKYLGSSAWVLPLELTPGARDIKWAMDQWENKDERGHPDVQVGLSGAMADAGHSVVSLAHAAMNWMNGRRANLERKDAVAIANTFSNSVGGFPVKAAFGVYDMAEAKLSNPFVPSIQEQYMKQLNSFQKSDAAKSVTPEENAALEAIKKQLDTPPPSRTGASVGGSSLIPYGTLDTIKQIESGGDIFAKNPKSSAAGLYQFTTKTWDDIKSRAPQLALTDAGRTSANPDQQEKAMIWNTEQNIKVLKGYKVPITTDTIYAAHFLGADTAGAVLTASPNTKLKLLVTSGVMNSNDFANGMKVRDFKKWVANKVLNATPEAASLDNENTAAKD